MKTYQVTAHYEDGKVVPFSQYRVKKVIEQQVEQFKKNRLIKKISISVYEDDKKLTTETVWEKNEAAQALGKLSALARDTSSEAMRQLVNKRWNK